MQRLKMQGVGCIDNLVGMAALTAALSAPVPVLAACPVHWGQYLKQFGRAVPPFLSRFREEAAPQAKALGRQAVSAEELAQEAGRIHCGYTNNASIILIPFNTTHVGEACAAGKVAAFALA